MMVVLILTILGAWCTALSVYCWELHTQLNTLEHDLTREISQTLCSIHDIAKETAQSLQNEYQSEVNEQIEELKRTFDYVYERLDRLDKRTDRRGRKKKDKNVKVELVDE